MSAFTPEQEVRVREIVGEVLLSVTRHNILAGQSTKIDEMETAIAWALHEMEDDDA